MTASPERILVVANETVGGRALIDAIIAHRDKALEEGREISVVVVCPQNQPKKGLVVYDETVREAAENRLQTTLAQLREVGIDATGEIMDPDPYAATMDAFHTFGADRIIISTHPGTRSGWLRRDLIDRIRDDVDVPVEHVVVDLDADRRIATHTLVVANQTVGGEPLIGLLRGKAQEGPHKFIVICPQGGSVDGGDANERLAKTLERLREAGLDAIGQVMDPDPFTAIQNALQFYTVDEIVISTFPATRSGWMRSDLIERVQGTTALPVEHVVVNPSEAKEGVAG
jgi:hypothetical protein